MSDGHLLFLADAAMVCGLFVVAAVASAVGFGLAFLDLLLKRK